PISMLFFILKIASLFITTEALSDYYKLPSFLRRTDCKRWGAIMGALSLGCFGVHKFYLGQKKLGIAYLVFFWTFIPSILSFIDAIIYLCMDDQTFDEKYPPKAITSRCTNFL
ncbi:MAG: TM2 domain-containing protein, partial [Porphyromonadaceae bacterium]|nr:TM2 domain-containing protein [Porphyromonadaceae bacterium]